MSPRHLSTFGLLSASDAYLSKASSRMPDNRFTLWLSGNCFLSSCRQVCKDVGTERAIIVGCCLLHPPLNLPPRLAQWYLPEPLSWHKKETSAMHWSGPHALRNRKRTHRVFCLLVHRRRGERLTSRTETAVG